MKLEIFAIAVFVNCLNIVFSTEEKEIDINQLETHHIVKKDFTAQNHLRDIEEERSVNQGKHGQPLEQSSGWSRGGVGVERRGSGHESSQYSGRLDKVDNNDLGKNSPGLESDPQDHRNDNDHLWDGRELIGREGVERMKRKVEDWKMLRDERINAAVCADGNNREDLCSVPLPNLNRTRCKCDYDCAKFDDCCVDITDVRRRNDNDPMAPTALDTRKWECFEKGGFYVVRSCPSEWGSDSEVRQRCEWDPETLYNNNLTTTYLNNVPIYAERDSTMYHNIFCAICNRATDALMPYRRARLVCDNEGTPMDDATDDHITVFTSEVIENLVEHGNLSFNVGTGDFNLYNGKFKHKCVLDVAEFRDLDFHKTYVLRFCIESMTVCQRSFFSAGEKELANKCTSYTSYVHDKITRRNYKNYHCALCDGVKNKNIECGAHLPRTNWDLYMITRTAYEKPLALKPWPWLFNGPYADKCKTNELYDDLLHVCVFIGCPRNYVWVDTVCKDILDTLPDPYLNSELTDRCQAQRVPFEYTTPLDLKKLYINHTGRTYLPQDYYLTRNETNHTDYAYFCDEEWISFEWGTANVITFNLLNYISILGQIGILILHIVVYELRVSQWGKNITMTCIAMLCANITFAVSLSKEPFTSGCTSSGMFNVFFHVAVFCWGCAGIFHMYKVFYNKIPTKFRRGQGPSTKKFGMFSWGMGGFLAILATMSDGFGADVGVVSKIGEPLCFISTQIGFIVFMWMPLCLLLATVMLAILLVCHKIFFGRRPPPRIVVAGRLQPSTDPNTISNRNKFWTLTGFVFIIFMTWTSVFIAVRYQVKEAWGFFSFLYGFQGIWLAFRTTFNSRGFWKFVDEITHKDPRHTALRTAGVMVNSVKDLPALVMPEDHSHREPTPCPLTPKFSTEISRKNLLLAAPSAPGQSRRPSAIAPVAPPPTSQHRYGPPVTNLIPATPKPCTLIMPPRFPTQDRKMSAALQRPLRMNELQPPLIGTPIPPTPTSSQPGTMLR